MNCENIKEKQTEWNETCFMAESSAVFLPIKVDEQGKAIYYQSVHTYSKILRSKGLDCQKIPSQNVEFLEQHSIDVFLPEIAFLFNFYQENQGIIDIIISSVKDYILAKMGSSNKDNVVKFDISLIDKDKKTKKTVSYCGHESGIDSMKSVLKELKNE